MNVDQAWQESAAQLADFVYGEVDVDEDTAPKIEKIFRFAYQRALLDVMTELGPMLLKMSDAAGEYEVVGPQPGPLQPLQASPVRTEWPWSKRMREKRETAPPA